MPAHDLRRQLESTFAIATHDNGVVRRHIRSMREGHSVYPRALQHAVEPIAVPPLGDQSVKHPKVSMSGASRKGALASATIHAGDNAAKTLTCCLRHGPQPCGRALGEAMPINLPRRFVVTSRTLVRPETTPTCSVSTPILNARTVIETQIPLTPATSIPQANGTNSNALLNTPRSASFLQVKHHEERLQNGRIS